MSHDLKAPLLSINKLLDYLKDDYLDKLDNDGRELIGTIHEKSVEVIGIVDHLLEFSKMCEINMQLEKISLNEVFDKLFKDLASYEPQRKIIFNMGNLPYIKGDPVMIKLLVYNILSNALKYSRNREETVIKVDSETSESEYTISVKDNGTGFNMAYSSRLFGVFQRLHSQSEFEGSGIGLAICQRILTRHNGKAWMTGEVDNGATFYFTFPRA